MGSVETSVNSATSGAAANNAAAARAAGRLGATWCKAPTAGAAPL